MCRNHTCRWSGIVYASVTLLSAAVSGKDPPFSQGMSWEYFYTICDTPLVGSSASDDTSMINVNSRLRYCIDSLIVVHDSTYLYVSEDVSATMCRCTGDSSVCSDIERIDTSGQFRYWLNMRDSDNVYLVERGGFYVAFADIPVIPNRIFTTIWKLVNAVLLPVTTEDDSFARTSPTVSDPTSWNQPTTLSETGYYSAKMGLISQKTAVENGFAGYWTGCTYKLIAFCGSPVNSDSLMEFIDEYYMAPVIFHNKKETRILNGPDEYAGFDFLGRRMDSRNVMQRLPVPVVTRGKNASVRFFIR